MTRPAAAPSRRIGIDIGGTFTDLVLADAQGGVRVYKVPTVPADPGQGVLHALDAAASDAGLSVPDLLAGTTLFVHGSTIATNTLLEHKGAKVGMLASAGFRDAIEIRRGMRDNPWDHRTPFPPVLAPRHLRRPLRGRLDRDGRELTAIMTEDVAEAAAIFRAEGVESVAVALFNSFLDPAHEKQAAELLRKAWDGAWISLSATIAPVMGEYERSSTAVLNAYVAPRTVAYLRALNERLAALGLPRSMLLIQNNGGAVLVEEVADRPATLLLSGPAAGIGALNFYSHAIGSDDLVSMEIGGTSCDVIVMSGGEVAFTDLLDIGGYHAVIPSVEVHTIGAGGGTIADLDGGGMLRVGPQGAGARPGPACYGLGCALPTVTDAQVVLGRLAAGTYAGGAVAIDETLAADAIDRVVARPLGLSRDVAAAGIIRLMEQKLLHAVQRFSIERGHDPRRFTLVAAGGAGPLHGAAVGRQLGCRRVYVPRLSGAFCALGMLHADVRHDYVRVQLARLDDVDPARVEAGFAALEDEARATLAREGFAGDDLRLGRALDLRYIGQQWDIQVPLRDVPWDPATIRADFDAEHDRRFGHTQPGGIIEITKQRVIGFGRLPPLRPASMPRAATPAMPAAERPIWLDATQGWRTTPVYRGADLLPGHGFDGPAVIDEQTTTVLVGFGDRLEVDAAGNYVIHLPVLDGAAAS